MIELVDNRYRVLKTLGSGLSGEVLAVEDSDGKKALKFLKRVQMNISRQEALANFKSEFSILAELNHPGIARILDFGFDLRLEKYFFTTELIEGKDFFAACAGLSAEAIEELAVQVLRALQYLHSRGIYHFDIKPQNILVAEREGRLQAKIIDFGLAGFAAPRRKVGTPAYMAPEIILGGGLDGRTDLYSFGVVLYKCLTKENPFAAKELRETLNRQRTLIPNPPSQANPGLPKYLDQIVLRLLEKLPSDRYAQPAAVIRDINFLANKGYELETADTRLSYIPEKGNLVSRRKEMDIFKSLFEMIFKQESGHPGRLLSIEGKTGTGKSRLLSEFKYYSQLNDVPVNSWKTFNADGPKPPFCLMIDEADGIGPHEVNRVLQQFANERILIVWATQKAPSGWSQSETLRLENFTEQELSEYLGMVTSLKDPPAQLVKEIYGRTDGNPLFVTELLKAMLANNLLLDSEGRWASSTFEDIGINFEKIQVPKTLSGLLLDDYARLPEGEKKILEWMAVLNRPASIETLKALSGIGQPHASILRLTKHDLIERADREQHYFFSNVMMREVLYASMDASPKRGMHDAIADFLGEDTQRLEEYLHHRGHGADSERAIRSLESLAEQYVKEERVGAALSVLEEAWERAKGADAGIQVRVETRLAEHAVALNDLTRAVAHFEHLKEVFDTNPRFTGDLEKRVQVYEKLGGAYGKLSQFDRALELFSAALQWLGEVPNAPGHRLLIQNHVANIRMKKGELDLAEGMFRENYRIWETRLGEAEKKRVDNNWLADVLILKQQYAEALAQIEKDLEFFERAEKRSLIARSGYLKGDVHFRIFLGTSGEEKYRHKELAIQSFEKALKIAKQIDARDLMLRIYNGIGNLHFHLDEYADANRNYERAFALARKFQDPQNLRTAAIIAMNMANVYKKQKSYRDAYSHLIYAINTWEGLEQKDAVAWLNLFRDYTEIAEVYIEMGELARAEDAVNRAERIMRANEHLKPYEFWIWYLRAPIYRRQSRGAPFKRALEKAQSLAKDGFERDMLKEFQETVKAEELADKPASPAAGLAFKPMKEDSRPATVPELETILQINKFINSEHNPDHLLKMVLNFALELSGAESGLVLLLDDSGSLEVKASVNVKVDEKLTSVSTSVARQAIESGEAVISEDAAADARFDSAASIVMNELKSVVCVPLKSKNKVVGVLYLDNRYRSGAFRDVNVRLLNAYCDQVGIALENARLIANYQAVQKKLEEALKKTEGELEEAREMLKSEASAFHTRYSYSQIISKSKPMQEIFKVLDKITETNLSVYLQGASGTGKELIARAIHFNNPQRSERRFVAINCGAIPANLIESELFGHKAGSFTGAAKDKKGLFEEAHGGTIFLDEIGELKPDLQVRLLRVLQEGEIQRVGEVTPVKVDARVVCASHKVLEDMVRQGSFREDLYYRLCQIKVMLPPLSERREDIPLLVEHFVEKFRRENKVKEKIKVSPALMKTFFHYGWPGNVRELENMVNVACALRNGQVLDPASLPQNYGIGQSLKAPSPAAVVTLHAPSAAQASDIPVDERNFFDPSKTWEQYEAVIIAKCFRESGFKKAQAASELGISQATLYNKVRALDLEARDNPLYADPFNYEKGQTLKSYLPKVFKAALQHAEGRPYAAIRQLGVSQGYFYKIIKQTGDR